MILKEAWEQSLKLFAEGDILFNEGHKLRTEGLRAEGNKLIAEGNKLYVEGDKLYAKAVEGFFEPDASINWLTGDVEGKPLPIPACELGIK